MEWFAAEVRSEDGDVDARGLLQDQDAVLAALRVENLDIVAFEHAGQGEDVADVVVDDQHLRTCELRHLNG